MGFAVPLLPNRPAVPDLDDQTGGAVDGILATLTAVGSPALIGGAAAQADVNARLATINDNLADVATTANTTLARLRAAGVLRD